ncbi:MAG: hypothetical protein EXS03_03910 [Phycisphaerales bacterium]|nr:hypothetical protein [Phycisphaerales bacterium]
MRTEQHSSCTSCGPWTRAALAATIAFMTGCATPSAIPEGTNAPSIVRTALPAAHRALFDWAEAHDDKMPDTSTGESIVLQAVSTRSLSTDEIDAGGNPVQLTETIDALAYAYRPAQDQCVLAVAGHIVRKPTGGGTPLCAWYCYRGRYTNEGVIIPDQTTYFENAELFVDAMRGTSHQVPWNSSAWAINRIFDVVSASQGASMADALSVSFVKSAIATGRARVPTGMAPRQAAFGGISSRGATGATPPSDQ